MRLTNGEPPGGCAAEDAYGGSPRSISIAERSLGTVANGRRGQRAQITRA